MMARRVTIFDFDGTIADSQAAAVAVYNEVAIRLRVPLITAENGGDLRRMKPREALRALGIPFWKVPLIMNGVRTGMHTRSQTLEPFPGMVGALRGLREAGCACSILSSNARENIEPFLARHGIEPFDHYHCGASLFGKGARLRKLVRSLGPPLPQAFYIGDEIRDIAAAAEAGIRSVAVSWGYGDRSALAAERPDFLVDAPGDLVTIIAG